MKEKKLYFNELNVSDSNDYSYCVDMLRLKTEISNNDFQKKIASRVPIYYKQVEQWRSSKISDFYYNYQYIDSDCSFWFGFISNKARNGFQNEKKLQNLTIEFNPNKCKNNRLLLDVLSVSSQWSIKSLDFAFDIKTNILNLTGFDKGYKKCFKTFDNGKDNKTFYFGEKNNRVKIYNKKIESELDIDLTRIEITKTLDLDIQDLKNIQFGYFPTLYLKDYQLDFTDIELDKTLSALVYAVNHGYPLHDLTRYSREKVKTYLQQKKPIKIDFSCFTSTLNNYISFYFPALNI